MFKLVFYSPGPYCNTDIYEIVDFGDVEPTDKDLAEIGYEMAVSHYESYGDPCDDDMEPEYDYAWYSLDDPEVQGRI